MPKRPKVSLPDLPTDEIIRRLFPQKVVESVQEIIQRLDVRKKPHKPRVPKD